MSKCKSCGQEKSNTDPTCHSCNVVDERVVRGKIGGVPLLTLLIIGLLIFSIYRFWIIGWSAITGNIRVIALSGIFLGITGLIFSPLWSFGIKTRKTAIILLIISVIIYLILNFI